MLKISDVTIYLGYLVSGVTFVFGAVIMSGFTFAYVPRQLRIMFGIVLMLWESTGSFLRDFGPVVRTMKSVMHEECPWTDNAHGDSLGIRVHKKNNDTRSRASHLLTADPYLALIQQEVEQYLSLYPQVKAEARGTSTREAIVHLLNDSVRSIVIDRSFNQEERETAMHASMKIVESKLAEDGVAIIVHQQNPIPYITAEFVQRIVTRLATDWAQIPESRGSGPIDLVLTGRNSGMYELLQSKLFPGSKLLEPSAIMNNQHDVIQYVSTHPHSVGYIAASLVAGGASSIIKVLPLRVKSSEGEEKDYFPGPQEIHGALYPFHYSLYLYNAEAKVAVGLGFNAFILSNVGQKIIQKAGLVPVSIPYRTIQLTAE